MFTLKWITKKELERVIENKGDEFRRKRNMKIQSGGENMRNATASGNVASMREPLDGSLWWYWIAANAAKKNGTSFKNYHRRRSS